MHILVALNVKHTVEYGAEFFLGRESRKVKYLAFGLVLEEGAAGRNHLI